MAKNDDNSAASDEVQVIHLSDDPQFSEELESLFGTLSANPADVVLDFSSVSLVNSSNMARMLKLRRVQADKKRRLVICGLNTAVWSTLLLTGLDQVFTFTDNVPTAIARLHLDA